MATKIYVVTGNGPEVRLIEAKNKPAVKRYLVQDALANISIGRATVHKVAELVADGAQVEQAYGPEAQPEQPAA